MVLNNGQAKANDCHFTWSPHVEWASYQIRKIAGCAFVGKAGIVFRATALISSFLWSRWWRGKRSRLFRRMRNPQFYLSGKRPMEARLSECHQWTSTRWINIKPGVFPSSNWHAYITFDCIVILSGLFPIVFISPLFTSPHPLSLLNEYPRQRFKHIDVCGILLIL